ncbi:acetolactate synthase large subunit [Haloactinospora alba]|uniref:Acetolactate synthase n=1 Tax=Haloactinospora alba TaxID=405555 RepID=A0A543NNQ0_9ACTN|nr:acetolactate synthase large subunit [Haloactinospora alba]
MSKTDNDRSSCKENAPHVTPAPQTEPETTEENEHTTGADILVAELEASGIDTVFGIPGGAILPAYDALRESGIRHVLVRHEQGAGHAAQGYARSIGRPGVCVVTSGPGATNLLTPLADAHMDSVPLVAVTGQVPREKIGTDAFQEADICASAAPFTKHTIQITSADRISGAVIDALRIASTGRPGPVLLDITKDALTERATREQQQPPSTNTVRPPAPEPAGLAGAVSLIREANRPVVYAGGGVRTAGAEQSLLELAELTGIPVVTTLMALGVFPEDHRLHLGMPGMHGTVTAVGALQQSDLLLAVGARFDDRVTGELASFAPHARLVHIDIDPAEIGKNRKADVGITADADTALRELTARLRTRETPDLTPWWRTLERYRARYPLGYTPPPDGRVAAQYVMERLSALRDADTVFTAGVGQHQMWAAQFMTHTSPTDFATSSGLGTMGFAVPAALGAKAARPRSTVWAIDGDGSFQMTGQELATCLTERLPVKVALINNGSLGMVRQWQNLFYDQRYSHTDLGTHHSVPDFVRMAQALGCAAWRCEYQSDVDAALAHASRIDDRPVVIEFVVPADAMVWPMVPAGTSNDAIMAARSMAPVWEPVSEDAEEPRDRSSSPPETPSEHTVRITAHTPHSLLPQLVAVLRRFPTLAVRHLRTTTAAGGETTVTLGVSGAESPLRLLAERLAHLVEVADVTVVD